jgi:hypothetical protein
VIAYAMRDRLEAIVETHVLMPRQSKANFDIWLSADRARQQEFAAFSAFLDRSGEGQSVAAWQLTRADGGALPSCPKSEFAIPPRALWPNILPALRITRTMIVPAIGRVNVVSAYRPPALNRCVRGASRSAHLLFKAVDLAPADPADKASLFATLCRLHSLAGPSSGFGLGAYFDPKRPHANDQMRFHIDGAGYRAWGFTYHAASSGCALLTPRNGQ